MLKDRWKAGVIRRLHPPLPRVVIICDNIYKFIEFSREASGESIGAVGVRCVILFKVGSTGAQVLGHVRHTMSTMFPDDGRGSGAQLDGRGGGGRRPTSVGGPAARTWGGW